MVFAAVNESEQTDEPYEFTVAPGTQAWNDMTPKQRIESCKVSYEEMERMTTTALISTILEYPYVINIFAYDSAEAGIDSLSDSFSGIEILLSRDDALDELSMYLRKMEDDENGSAVDELVLKTLIDYMNYGALMENDNLSRASKATVYTPNGTAVAAQYDRTWWDEGFKMVKLGIILP